MINVGFALCGSFCTFKEALIQIENLVKNGYSVTPIMSFNAATIDTRFGKAASHISRIEEITGHRVISTIEDAEPIGPKKLIDALIIEPCTGNTLAKLACGVADTPVTLAAKAHLRNERPIVIAVSSNDALAAAAVNIGKLINRQNYYFVPYRQDDPYNKSRSIIADFTKTIDTLEAALDSKQIQPVICTE